MPDVLHNGLACCLVPSCHKSFQRSVKILVSNVSVNDGKVPLSFLFSVILTFFELQELQIMILLFKKQAFSLDL